MRKLLLLLISIFSFLFSFSQPYGKEWIVSGQQYFVVKIANNGVFRLPSSLLNSVGLPLATANPINLQLFLNGKEQALHIQGLNGQAFDFIEFYGKKNDAKLDQSLYSDLAFGGGDTSFQVNPFYSLYNDTSYYYLTYSSSGIIGKRFQTYSNVDFTQPAETSFLHEEVVYFADEYFRGASIDSYSSVLSEYTEGEGYVSSTFGKKDASTITSVRSSIPSKDFINNGTIPFMDIISIGRSASTGNPEGLNHHVKIEVSNDGVNFIQKEEYTAKGYQTTRSRFNLLASELGNNFTDFRLSVIDDKGYLTDFNSVAIAKLTYPRGFSISSNSFLFKFSASPVSGFSHLQFKDFIGSNPLLYDLTKNYRIQGVLNGSNIDVNLPEQSNNRELLIVDESLFSIPTIASVSIPLIDVANADFKFLIVSSKKLKNSAEDYERYRELQGLNTLLVYTEDLYTIYTGGRHHPMAIRRFLQDIIQNAPFKPEYLLLLGKGEQHITGQSRDIVDFNSDLVPSLGVPPSDNLFTTGLNTISLEPGIATGRIAANNDTEVIAYLDKLKIYENTGDEIWRKKLIHLTGGQNQAEYQSFKSHNLKYQRIVEAQFFGGKVADFDKKVNEPITIDLKQSLINKANEGISLFSYFGHGAGQGVAVDFGKPSELSNTGKYGVYLMNGCSVGNPNTPSRSLGEDYILTPAKGAIAWLGTSDLGYSNYLDPFTEAFYKNSFQKLYGESIGKIIKQNLKEYTAGKEADKKRVLHSRQYFYQGDPAIKFYSPMLPDYAVNESQLFITPENFSATSDSFYLAIPVQNLGKAPSDSITVGVKRTLEGSTTPINLGIKKFKPVFFNDTIYYLIKSNDLKTKGSNIFEVFVDATNDFSESNELNNKVTKNIIVPANGINLIYPRKNAIAFEDTIKLIIQSNNLFIGASEYLIEIDTINNFSSGFLKKYGPIAAKSTLIYHPDFKPEENKVYYWRSRLNVPDNQGGSWEKSQFTYKKSAGNGWSQSKFDQLSNAGFVNIEIDSLKNEFKFVDNFEEVKILTGGDSANIDTLAIRGLRINGSRPVFLNVSPFNNWNGIFFIAVDPVSFKRFTYYSKYSPLSNNSSTTEKLSGCFYFDLRNSVIRDSMLFYINAIPQGYYVYAFNGFNLDAPAFPESVYQAFESIGSGSIRTLGKKQPYALFGRKGSPIGSAQEYLADSIGSGLPAIKNIIEITVKQKSVTDRGSIFSERIGPAISWSKAEINTKKTGKDSVWVGVIGIRDDGVEKRLVDTSQTDQISLANIDASIYPYLKLWIYCRDIEQRTVPIINSTKFEFKGYPEGSFNPDMDYVFYNENLEEGDSIKIKIAYQNLGNEPTDSVSLLLSFTDKNNQAYNLPEKRIGSVAVDGKVFYESKISTINYSGKNRINLSAQPLNKRDFAGYNNFIQKNITVNSDKVNPLLNVFFDGKRLLNNEIVSPTPFISITSIDENKYRLLNDTSSIELFLKEPGSDIFNKINYTNNSALNFIPAKSGSNKNEASVEYKPTFTKDGIYFLKVINKDASNNRLPNNEYEIGFEVINESSISNFYPYPNPFSTKMKFVFTLTGSEIPNDLKIQIMTVSGKVVREINRNELGILRIGNNISDFTWDGTDQFGDKLANGVYFYKVTSRIGNNSIKDRKTSGDKYFKKDIGKIYLMR